MKRLHFVVLWALAAVLTGALASCRSMERTAESNVYAVKADTVCILQFRTDTLHCRDSVFVREYVAGDTFYKERDRWHTVYRARLVHDTLYRVRTDTVRVAQKEETGHKEERREGTAARLVRTLLWGVVAGGTVYYILHKTL